MTTARAMVANARRDRVGRLAILAIRVGAAIASVGISELHLYLRSHPLMDPTHY